MKIKITNNHSPTHFKNLIMFFIKTDFNISNKYYTLTYNEMF